MTKRTVTIKLGKRVYAIDENDLLLFETHSSSKTGEVITKVMKWKGSFYHPRTSTRLFKKLKTNNLIYTNNELQQKARDWYGEKFILYKFDIEAMKGGANNEYII